LVDAGHGAGMGREAKKEDGETFHGTSLVGLEDESKELGIELKDQKR
jgi:hypothetical protein